MQLFYWQITVFRHYLLMAQSVRLAQATHSGYLDVGGIYHAIVRFSLRGFLNPEWSEAESSQCLAYILF